MAAKHTPGPWHWDSDPAKGDPLGRVRYRVTTTGKTVTQCYYSSSDPQAEWDARLIAAAPDLLAALQDMHQVLQEAMSTGGWVPTPLQSSFREAWVDVTAAIAKATGGAA